jgi:DUF1680 family protein
MLYQRHQRPFFETVRLKFEYPDQLLQIDFYTILSLFKPFTIGAHNMEELPAKKVRIRGGFWGPRLAMNAQKAINHQWEQLERTGCIHNFRLVADGAGGIREGFFFADSDAYKWLEAASRVIASHPSGKLKDQIDNLIDLIRRTQTKDGYIFTYNQYFTPTIRWQNLQIEHELYCHGHLIEAGVSHYVATGSNSLLDIAIKAADLLVCDFSDTGPEGTPGHQEIEIALIRLYHVTHNSSYLDLAAHFIEQRGRIKPFITHILAEKKRIEERSKKVDEAQEAFYTAHPEHVGRFQLPDDNVNLKPTWGEQRWFLNTASGKYFQQHVPVREQFVPVGHAVRFAYLETAIAMLYREQGDSTLLSTLEKAWDHMVTRRMYVTGGIGALPNIEGFGRDYELDPVYSYSETCAALGVILWNWEMTLVTQNAKYADLTEWQLYNAAAVGLGQDGTSYLYNNPLSCQGEVTRKAWFKCPCCPSNISRIWADLGRYAYSFNQDGVWVHQYIESAMTSDGGLGLEVKSGFPWDGDVTITLVMDAPSHFTVYLRIPSWCDDLSIMVNGEPVTYNSPLTPARPRTASGYDPHGSWYLPLKRSWSPADKIEIEFGMGIRIRTTHPRVRATRGQSAISRGPLVYCLESIDNPDLDLFDLKIDPGSLDYEYLDDLFNGVAVLRGKTLDGSDLKLIPYYSWANRGESQMTVYAK